MKRFLLLLIGLAALGWVQGEDAVSSITVLETEFWHVGDEVFLDVEAKADVFLFGRDLVEIDGTYHQDLWAAGRRVEFRGVAHDDVRLAAAEFLTVDGEMTGGTLRALSGQNLLVNTNAVLRGSAHLTATRNLTLNGDFIGNVTASGSRIIVAARVDGDLTLNGSEITVMPGSRISGTLFYSGDRPPHLPQGVIDTDPVAVVLPESGGDFLGQYVWMIRAIQLFSSFVIGLMLVRFLPRFTGNCVETVLKLQPQCMFLGLMTTLLLGFTGYFLMVSVLGLGVGLVLLTVLGLLFYSGKIVLALALGALVVKHREPLTFFRLSLGLLVGLVLLYAAFSLPWVGTTLWIIVSCWGMGAMVHSIRNSQRVLKLEIPPDLRED
ncbi:MAG: hypothetical protein JJU05_06460 [Verrucomicrobia bacterium]|nr:hypothetical protein [Verrucomicrobiota bacterium]MCH8525718.1 hypothetical protein [Kiritimatiellia bacterium]